MSEYCRDCNGTTESVFDHATGDVICTHCGLVLDSHCIDDTPEWRTFTNDHSNSDYHDPNRIGYSSNPFFASHLSTLISKPTGPKPDSGLLGLDTLHNKMIKNPEAQFEKALAMIDNMGEQLGVISSIKEHAKLIYTNLTSTNNHKPPSCFRGKYHDAFLGACLYVACNHEGLPRTVKEISWVANGASKKDILRGKAYISKQLVADEHETIVMETTMDRVVRAGDLVKRFCSNIGVMNSKVMKAAQETVVKLEDEIDIRRSPVSVAAAVVYVIRQLMSCDDNNNKKKKKGNNNNNNNDIIIQEIAKATGVAQGTIKNAYRDIYPHLSKIVPFWFAQPHDLARLSCPSK